MSELVALVPMGVLTANFLLLAACNNFWLLVSRLLAPGSKIVVVVGLWDICPAVKGLLKGVGGRLWSPPGEVELRPSCDV